MSKEKSTLHLMVGLPCSGKTTLARRLEIELDAIRFNADEWQIKLFLQEYDGSEEHDRIHNELELMLDEVAFKLLPRGVSVILDYGFWNREQREFYRAKARELGVDFRIHYCDCSTEERLRRLRMRNAELASARERGEEANAFTITEQDMRDFEEMFEPPSSEELERD